MKIEQVAVFLLLAVNTIKDIRKQEIFPRMTLIFLGAGLLLRLLYRQENLWLSAAALFPAVLLLVTARLSKEAIGYGDGLVLLAMGSYLELWQILECLSLAAFAAALAAAGLWWRKRDKNQRMPFLPFLLLGYLGSCL